MIALAIIIAAIVLFLLIASLIIYIIDEVIDWEQDRRDFRKWHKRHNRK